MFRNYIVVAFRNFWRNKVFTLINMAGLAIGISAALIIYMVVMYEYSFDTFHKDGDRIYRVVSTMHFPDQEFKNNGVPQPLPAMVRDEMSGVEITAHIFGFGGVVGIPQEGATPAAVFKKQEKIVFAEPDYFRLFTYQWVSGDPSVLKEPNRVVLSESRAKTYFSDAAKAMGRTIVYDDSITVTVAGIVKDLEGSTDLNSQEFISYPTVVAAGLGNSMGWGKWGNVNSASQCFLKVAPGVNIAQLEKQITAAHATHEKDAYLVTDHFLQPISAIHFSNDFGGLFSQRQANRTVLNGLLAVAAFLLLLGCINFINLATAQAARRAKEIGIRKTVGGSRRQLIGQFLGETFLLILLSILLCVALTPWLLKVFSGFIPPDISFSHVGSPQTLLFLAGLTLLLTVLAGGYPSLVLSRYQPVLVLKNQAAGQGGKTRRAWLRKSLTVTQFVIAQFFIIATIVVSKQIHYSMNKEMGFRKDAIINVPIPWEYESIEKKKVLLAKIAMLPGVENATLGGAPPASDDVIIQTVKYTDDKKELETTVEIKMADSAYFSLYNMQLLAGRFPKQADSISELAVNEHYARLIGFSNPQDAVGKMVDGNTPIVGVMKDFHNRSMHEPIQPLAYGADVNRFYYVHVLLKPQSPDGSGWPNTIAGMKGAWKDVYPGSDFEYRFFDESIAQFYTQEQNTSQLLAWATGLTILISCLGLFGLVLYTTNLRTKEIGIRKVLGASVAQIVSILSADFLRLVGIAFVIAAPLAWWGMHEWLQSYAYRTELSWWVFVAGGLVLFLLALVVLCTRTIRAASANPVKSLRTE